MSWQPGATIGPYLLESRLGQGGMGEVWRAHHLHTGAPRALKVLRTQDPDLHERFRREGEAMARLDHPAVVRVHEFFALGPELILALELAEGGSLNERLREGPLAPDEAIRVVIRLAQGLTQVHAAGALHRDIKPDNVLFDAAGQPKLGDFGLARLRDSEQALTRTGELLGTPAYMAPEQALSRPCDERTDVYGLGALLYHCLTGRPPFERSSTIGLLDALCTEEPAPPRQLVPSLPDWLSRLCLQALAKEPAARPPSAEAFADALAREQAPPRGGAPWLLAAALLALATFVGLYAALPRSPARPAGPTPSPSPQGSKPTRPPPTPTPPPLPLRLPTWELCETERSADLPFVAWDGPRSLLIAGYREDGGHLERWSPAPSGALQRDPLTRIALSTRAPLALLEPVGADVVWAGREVSPERLRPGATPAPWKLPLEPGEEVEGAARWGAERVLVVASAPAPEPRAPRPTRLLVVEAASGALLHAVPLERHCEYFREVAGQPEGSLVALSFSDDYNPVGGLHLVQLSDAAPRAQRTKFPAPRSLCWRGAELLVVNNVRRSIVRVDTSRPLAEAERGETLYAPDQLGGQPRRVAATSSGRLVVTVTRKGVSLRVFDGARRTTLLPPQRLEIEPKPYPLLRLSPDGSHAAVLAPRYLWIAPLPRD